MIHNVERQSGKTTECVRLLRKDKKVILVVPTLRVKDYIKDKFKLTKEELDRIIIAHTLFNGEFKIREGERLVFDELEGCLLSFYGSFDAYLTIEEVSPIPKIIVEEPLKTLSEQILYTAQVLTEDTATTNFVGKKLYASMSGAINRFELVKVDDVEEKLNKFIEEICPSLIWLSFDKPVLIQKAREIFGQRFVQ